MVRVVFSIYLLLILPGSTNAQVFYGGVFPEIAVSGNLGKGYKYTAKVESMHALAFKDDENPLYWDYLHDRTDLQLFLNHKLTPF